MGKERADLEAELLELGGGDPFDDVLRASNEHRESHAGCRLYPAGPRIMSLAGQVVRAAGPKTILDLGSGLGYSALWLASAAPPGSTVLGIDGDAGHVELARQLVARQAIGARIDFAVGSVAAVIEHIDGPVDLVHDDAWFGSKPGHFDRVVDLLPPGGVLTMANWFLLEDALGTSPRRDWEKFAGPRWREAVRAFAGDISADPRLKPVWITRPPLLLCVRR